MKFDIHPFFVGDLMQRLRHGEHDRAMRFVATELLHAVTDRGSGRSGGGDGSAGGDELVLLPTLKRRQALDYDIPFETHSTHLEMRHD